MHTKDNRIEDRRKSSFDFRKNKINRRKSYRRLSDKINYSIYYIVIGLLTAILTTWFLFAFNDVIRGIL